MADAQSIKSALTMRDVFARYGFTPNRAGFVRCPFHTEKTASLGTFDEGRRWKCFGCGAGGDVISFVQRLHGIGFAQAVLRMTEDFGLPGGSGADGTKSGQAARKLAEQRRAEQQRVEREALASSRDEWTAHFRRFLACEEAMQWCHPIALGEPMLPVYAWALHHIEYEWAWLCEHAWG